MWDPVAEGVAGRRRSAAEVMSPGTCGSEVGERDPTVLGSGWGRGSGEELLGFTGNSFLPGSWWALARETRPGP